MISPPLTTAFSGLESPKVLARLYGQCPVADARRWHLKWRVLQQLPVYRGNTTNSEDFAVRLTLAIAMLLGLAKLASADTLDAIKHPYQQNLEQSCSAGGFCVLLFPITTNSRTLVSHVSCFINVLAGDYPSEVILGSNGLQSRNDLPVTSMGTNTFVAGTSNFVVSGETYLFYEKGTQPDIYIATNQSVQAAICTISGYYLE